MIAKLFTEEEKKAFFEGAGFRVEMQEYEESYKATHGTWETATYQTLCVCVNGEWCKMLPLFEEIMSEKLKSLLMSEDVLDVLMIPALAKGLSSNDKVK